ncbi:prepilin peptidase [Staphylococcus coagulans]|uniref:prepilin peptidase n=1 Tax=Staphylococcus coagulans TaxID=74706 RepID=UPI00067E4D5A|nr:prepilin peptidase [Staphylococcus coagulans]MBA8763169.1 prepilin peptidase [Staphylococcus coagulans]MBA8773288.1 prepilin peptidase [Staphylococcus coagulans]MBT2808745.1 prepilin peptidase [Staphylococcus coagulans]MBT2810990.1 prepilin peptidase [Staphylococcus coagulans]MBT2814086.1 prepilin peptidase [Staphylococcus coagulans]
MQYFTLFLVGCISMSFLLQFAEHPNLKIKHLIKRSRCIHCFHQLKMTDLIPIVSFVLFSGRCRYCSQPIPRSLLIGELLGGILLVYPTIFPIYVSTEIFYAVGLMLLTIGVIDLHSMIVQHRFLVLLFVLLLYLSHHFYVDLQHVILFLSLFFIGLIQNHLIGFGDIKLCLVMIFFFPMLFLYLFLELIFPVGCFFYLLTLLLKSKMTHCIPLVPSIFVSFILITSFYPHLINFYGGIL